MFFILLYFFEIIFKKVQIWKCSDLKFVQIRFFVRISNLFKFEFWSDFWIFLNSNFVQILNLFEFKIIQFQICSDLKLFNFEFLFRFWKNVRILYFLFRFEICSNSHFVQILKKCSNLKFVRIFNFCSYFEKKFRFRKCSYLEFVQILNLFIFWIYSIFEFIPFSKCYLNQKKKQQKNNRKNRKEKKRRKKDAWWAAA